MSRPFLIFKEYSAKKNLRSSVRSFRQILIVLLLRIYISSLLQKFHFAIEAVLDSLQTQRGTGTSF